MSDNNTAYIQANMMNGDTLRLDAEGGAYEALVESVIAGAGFQRAVDIAGDKVLVNLQRVSTLCLVTPDGLARYMALLREYNDIAKDDKPEWLR